MSCVKVRSLEALLEAAEVGGAEQEAASGDAGMYFRYTPDSQGMLPDSKSAPASQLISNFYPYTPLRDPTAKSIAGESRVASWVCCFRFAAVQSFMKCLISLFFTVCFFLILILRVWKTHPTSRNNFGKSSRNLSTRLFRSVYKCFRNAFRTVFTSCWRLAATTWD